MVGTFNDDVTHCIGATWMKWRLAFDVLCDKKYHLNLEISSTECVRGEVLTNQELIYLEDACSGYENFEINVWTY